MGHGTEADIHAPIRWYKNGRKISRNNQGKMHGDHTLSDYFKRHRNFKLIVIIVIA